MGRIHTDRQNTKTKTKTVASKEKKLSQRWMKTRAARNMAKTEKADDVDEGDSTCRLRQRIFDGFVCNLFIYCVLSIIRYCDACKRLSLFCGPFYLISHTGRALKKSRKESESHVMRANHHICRSGSFFSVAIKPARHFGVRFALCLKLIEAIRLILWDDSVFRCDDNNASQLIFTSFPFRHKQSILFQWNYSMVAHTAIFLRAMPCHAVTIVSLVLSFSREFVSVSSAHTLQFLQIILTLLLDVFNCYAPQQMFDSIPIRSSSFHYINYLYVAIDVTLLKAW